ncbi:MAG: hypothetical protein PHG00_13205 [Methylococcales bacterium]|nr:hypothetical protein [Methylococcales bacterium]
MNKSYLLKREQLDLKLMEDVFNNNYMVLNRPFEGMKYIDKSSEGALLPKILGSYEEPIQEWILQTIEKNHEAILDIGYAEGYYAVGFGMRMPNAKIIAYDVDQEARIKTGELIKLNGLSNIKIKAECTHVDLNARSKANTLLFCDIEGFEHYLLDPIKALYLRYVDLIVQSHDCFVHNVTEKLIARFYKTPIIKIAVDYHFRKNKYKTPNKFSSNISHEIINEIRSPAMKFLYMESLDGKL